MRYNEDDLAALEELAALEDEKEHLSLVARRTRAKMRAAQRLGYATDVILDRALTDDADETEAE